MTIRVSAGSAACMGLLRLKTDVLPTTVYLLHGEGCRMDCAFCPQARSGEGLQGRLGRISWPLFKREALPAGLKQAAAAGARRICLQSVWKKGGFKSLRQLLRELRALSALPISVSAMVTSAGEAAALFEAGAERLSIALDLANARLYARYKGGSFQQKLALLLECARRWPGKISTHLICGLGETEAEAVELMDLLTGAGVTVALFAFTPLKGTRLAAHPPPDPAAYRRLQAARYLIAKGVTSAGRFTFTRGRITSFGLDKVTLAGALKSGAAFQTSGCPGCNRPYYNERPGGFIYNYPRPLTPSESGQEGRFLLSTTDSGDGPGCPFFTVSRDRRAEKALDARYNAKIK